MLDTGLDRLYDDKLDGKITQDFYQSKFQQYSGELAKVSNSVKGHNTATTKYFEFVINIFELSQKAKDLFIKAKKLNLMEEQRRLLKLVFTEMKLNEGLLTYKYSPTFSLLSEAVLMTNSSKIRKIEQKSYQILEPQKKPDTMGKSGDFQPHHPIWLPLRDLFCNHKLEFDFSLEDLKIAFESLGLNHSKLALAIS